MTIRRTEQLIVDLAAGVSPVHPLPSVSARMLRWLTTAVAMAVVACGAVGLRADLSHAMTSPIVHWSLGLALLGSVSAAVMALRLSVPGADQSRLARWLPLGVLALLVAVLLQMARAAGVSLSAVAHEPFHAACVLRVVVVATLPTVLLVREVRRGFALDAASTAALAVLGGGALAAVAVQLMCPIDRPAHLLVSHILPVLGLVVVAAATTRVLPRLIGRPAL